MLDACPGVIAIQTIAGAISTGTHGQGLNQSTLSDAVLKLTVITPSGNIL
jgi:FAD/FMN-containing dehydrogenase